MKYNTSYCYIYDHIKQSIPIFCAFGFLCSFWWLSLHQKHHPTHINFSLNSLHSLVLAMCEIILSTCHNKLKFDLSKRNGCVCTNMCVCIMKYRTVQYIFSIQSRLLMVDEHVPVHMFSSLNSMLTTQIE